MVGSHYSRLVKWIKLVLTVLKPVYTILTSNDPFTKGTSVLFVTTAAAYLLVLQSLNTHVKKGYRGGLCQNSF